MKSYTETDQQLHRLCQIIAKANRTFVPKKDDDSHTNLYFDSLGNRIFGRWITGDDGDFIFTLNLNNQQIEILNTAYELVGEVKTITKALSDIEKEIEAFLPNIKLNPSGFSKKLHYEIPSYSFTNDPVQFIEPEKISEWKRYRRIANNACSLLMGHAQSWEEIRIWPHHFDTGIYLTLSTKLGVGFGLAMQDEMVGAPYFYMSAYTPNGAIEYQNLPKGKEWKWKLEENWKGAILSLSKFQGKAEQEQEQMLHNFLLESFEWFAKQK